MIPGMCSSRPYSQAALRCDTSAGARDESNAAEARMCHVRFPPMNRYTDGAIFVR